MTGLDSHPSADTALARIRFVLVEPTHSGNVGAVARAMKNMGLTRLVLVNPKCSIDADAIARAAGADDLLAAVELVQTLPEALTGCRLVVGTSARLRHLDWPMLDPRACGERLVAEAGEAGGEVALLLGRESSGLSNDELARCHFLAHIPTNPGFSSLNLAAAAQVFAYEVFTAQQAGQAASASVPASVPTSVPADLAPAEAMEAFHVHLAETLVDLGFGHAEQSHRLLQRLRRLFHRARPDRVELNILRGILSAAQGRRRAARGGQSADASGQGTAEDKAGQGSATLAPPDPGGGGR
jgi:tRNA (cytidine32/uridine32-2'-O)-methyltransferase